MGRGALIPEDGCPVLQEPERAPGSTQALQGGPDTRGGLEQETRLDVCDCSPQSATASSALKGQ